MLVVCQNDSRGWWFVIPWSGIVCRCLEEHLIDGEGAL